MFTSNLADPSKQNKLVKIFLRTPQIRLRGAMILTKYSDEEIKDKAFCCFLQCTLPGSSFKGLKAHITVVVPPPPDCTQQRQKRAIECTPPLTKRTPPDVDHVERAPATGIASSSPMQRQLFPNKEMNQGSAALKRKCKEYNMAHFRKRKPRALAMMTTTTMMTMTTTMTTMTLAVATSSSADPWSVTMQRTLRMPAAARKEKCKMVKPAVKAICQGRNILLEAAVLCAVADHPDLNAACKVAGIDTLKTLAASKILCNQSLRMMERACHGDAVCGKTSLEKHDAVKVVLTFSMPSPNKTADTPSMRDHACIMGVPSSMLHCVKKSIIEK
jgi:hypothetical protein